MMMESDEVIAWTQCNRESSTQWLNILTFILRPFTFVNLLHKLWGSQKSQGVSKTSVWKSLFQTVRQYKKNQLWYFQHYPISNGLLFGSFMTSCLTTYRYSYFRRLLLILLVSGYFCGMRYYAVVPTYRSEAIFILHSHRF